MAVTTNAAMTGIPSVSSLANPSASVGLTAVNGSASTAMRSDAAPALDQAIGPTWTARHVFSKAGGGLSAAVGLNSAAPAFSINETDGAADNKLWDILVNSEQFLGRVLTDDGNTAANWLVVDRTGAVVDSVALGGVLIPGKGISADSGGVKHARVTTGSVASSAAPLITITWNTPFPDANYTVAASVVDSTTSSLALRVAHVETITASAVTVRLKNDGAGAITGTVHVIAVHD